MGPDDSTLKLVGAGKLQDSSKGVDVLSSNGKKVFVFACKNEAAKRQRKRKRFLICITLCLFCENWDKHRGLDLKKIGHFCPTILNLFMTKTYLVEVIKALKPAERQEIALFLDSPLHNKGGNSKDLIQLYQVILNAAPEFTDNLLDKGKVYFEIFSDPKIVPGKLEKLMADLNKLLRVYCLTQQYFVENKEVVQQVDWVKWLRLRGLSDRSQQLMAKLISKDENVSLESLDRYRTNLWIAEEKHLWELNYNQVKGELYIPNLIECLDLYYHNYRTELANRYLLQQKATQLPEGDFFETDIVIYQEKSILLQISKKIFELLKEEPPSGVEIQHLIELLSSHEANLSFHTLDHFYAYLRNFCTLLINAGHTDFIPVLHQINKDNLARGFFLLLGKIPPHGYLNLVQIATRAKDYAWALKFTEDYKDIIVGGDEGQFYYRLNMAQCLLSLGQFEEALSYLPDSSSNTHYHHIIRRLELKLYYELRSELFDFKLDAFRKFIERTAPKSLADNIRIMNLNFCNILLQLSQSPPKDKTRSARLVQRD
ncbi:MAG: hypothetical protein ABL870_11045 [Sediminibacterium sp.]